MHNHILSEAANVDTACMDGRLTLAGQTILHDVPVSCTLIHDPLEHGVFLSTTTEAPSDRLVISMGSITEMRRFVCCHRYEPFWMRPLVGDQATEIPPETQFLLIQRMDGRYLIVLPILDGPFRASLAGTEDDQLQLIAESGDPAVTATQVTGLFLALGENPYTLITAATRSVMARMGTGRLRTEKPLPDFLDTFGWCTWDAFRDQVSADNVRKGLQSFADGGVSPLYMILDDGWQAVKKFPTGETRLVSFAGSARFPEGIAPVIHEAKTRFGITRFIAWHPLPGYFGGIDADAFPRYAVMAITKNYAPGIHHHIPDMDTWFGRVIGLVTPQSIHDFLQDYHRTLREQGVDGIKADAQASLESVAMGFGGRVTLMQRYREALEGSVQTHFLGRLINCMSCSTEMLYSALSSNITRTSGDYLPEAPAAHQGLHLYKNAVASYFTGELIQPDWDMFQSGHPQGTLHAVGRVLSGGPIYVSDTPDGHNFALLRKLVLADGTIPRALGVGHPTRDCLFHDPTHEARLYKIFNRNAHGGIVGVFNLATDTEHPAGKTLHGAVRPCDIEGLTGDRFALYCHFARTLTVCTGNEPLDITLAPYACEVVTIVPIEQQRAPIGITDKFNSHGVITHMGDDPRGGYAVSLRDGGDFLVWCERAPAQVLVDDARSPFSYEADGNALHIPLTDGPHTVRMVW